MNPLRRTFLSIPRILLKPITPIPYHKRNMSESKPFPSPQLPESLSSLSPTPSPKIHLYTAGTPNGFKVSILLEELLLAYPNNSEVQYDFYALSFANKDQKSDRFLKINPNGRIPALVDDNIKGGHNVFESVSCMIWLVEVSTGILKHGGKGGVSDLAVLDFPYSPLTFRLFSAVFLG